MDRKTQTLFQLADQGDDDLAFHGEECATKARLRRCQVIHKIVRCPEMIQRSEKA